MWYSIYDNFWNQCQWTPFGFCTGSDLSCTLQLFHQHMLTVERENAFQHHPQSLSNITNSLQNRMNPFRYVYWSCCTENAGDDQSGDPHSSPSALHEISLFSMLCNYRRAGNLCNTNSARLLQGEVTDKIIYIIKLIEASWNIWSLRKRNSSLLQDNVQQAFHRHPETFPIIQLQFYSHIVTEHQTYTRELQSYSVFHVHAVLMECALSIQFSLYPGRSTSMENS